MKTNKDKTKPINNISPKKKRKMQQKKIKKYGQKLKTNINKKK